MEVVATFSRGVFLVALYVGWGRRFLCQWRASWGPGFPVTSGRVCAMAKDVLARLLGAAAPDGAQPEAFDPDLKAIAPSLFALMTRLHGPSGGARTPSSLTIFCEDGCFKACLSERDFGLALWTSAPTLQGLFPAIEQRLSQEVVEWRRKPASSGNRKPKG